MTSILLKRMENAQEKYKVLFIFEAKIKSLCMIKVCINFQVLDGPLNFTLHLFPDTAADRVCKHAQRTGMKHLLNKVIHLNKKLNICLFDGQSINNKRANQIGIAEHHKCC